MLVLAALLPAHKTMINGNALCTALTVTERNSSGWPDCSRTVQIADSFSSNSHADGWRAASRTSSSAHTVVVICPHRGTRGSFTHSCGKPEVKT